MALKRIVPVAAFYCVVVGAAVACASESPSRRGDDQQSDRERILGTWEVIRYEQGGKTLMRFGGEEPVPGGARYIFTEDRVTYIPRSQPDNPRKWSRYDGFRIDPSASPKELDLINLHGGDVIYLMGVYEWDGDKLRWCRRGAEKRRKGSSRKRLSTGSRPRPNRVDTRRGDGATLVILKRVDDSQEIPER